MDTKITKLVAGVAFAGALTIGGVGTAGAAFAADSTDATGTTAPSGATGHPLRGHPVLRAEIRRGAINVITDTLGVTRAQLRDARKAGQSLNEYATSLGKDPQTVVDALTNAANTKLDELVANGKVTQERADTIKSRLPDRIAALMDRHFGQHARA